MLTEKEKMLAGECYQAWDEELFRARQRAKAILFDLNHLHPSELDKRLILLKQLLGQFDENSYIEPPFYCDYGTNIHIGNHFYANYHCTILDCAPVTIGDNVLFGPNVSLYTAAHPLDPTERNSGMEFAKPITIGNNVWLGGNVVVLPNVTIGDNVVIGAGSVVTRDIPPNCLAVGNPCRVLRPLSEADKIALFRPNEG